MQINKEFIAVNLPFTAKMAWTCLPTDTKDPIVTYINDKLAIASDDAAIDELFDSLEKQYPIISPVKETLKTALKKANK